MDAGIRLDAGEDYPEIREAVQRICAGYPGEYWRGLEDERAYPTEFVKRADRGRLSGRPHPRRVRGLRNAASRCGRNPGGHPRDRLLGRRLPRPDVHHGRAAAARQRGAEGPLPSEDRERSAAPAGIRRDRARQRHGHHEPEDPRRAQWRRVRGERPEGVDEPRSPVRPDAACSPGPPPSIKWRSALSGSPSFSSTCARYAAGAARSGPSPP